MKNYRFEPGWPATLALLVLVPLFASLGIWQLHRAAEKAALMELRLHMADEPIISGDGVGWAREENRYRRIELEGKLDVGHQFLLDNQILGQKPGYLVLTPLRIRGADQAILVNRGWIPLGEDRKRLPDLAVSRAEVRITGIIDNFPRLGFKLKGAETPAPGWPSVVIALDAARLSERLGYRLLPYQVLLAAEEADGYVREWKPTDLHPEKSQGYALQWFSFALVSITLYLWHGFKRKSVQ